MPPFLPSRKEQPKTTAKNTYGSGAFGDTVDGRNPAPPKKPWNDDSLQIPTNHGFNHGSKAVFHGLSGAFGETPLVKQNVSFGEAQKAKVELMALNHSPRVCCSRVAPSQ